ncbi:uncharacterized protein H6S33_004403 [Morchella sextelata]|uniref:uncharacterized protein n=1 Tax=Morchella sextelata TaxID=1174677 RepID=UPI001D03C9A8|nr:uncharacterized protein H6S33_004403 [Morchella sextelata]KAH0605946.1 hypothetical protein H6S33_004403 [Morchella sextelata]
MSDTSIVIHPIHPPPSPPSLIVHPPNPPSMTTPEPSAAYELRLQTHPTRPVDSRKGQEKLELDFGTAQRIAHRSVLSSLFRGARNNNILCLCEVEEDGLNL